MNRKIMTFLKKMLPIITFFVITVLVLGPLELFYSNSEEFWFGLNDVLKTVVPVSLSAFVVLCLSFFIFPKSVRNFFSKLLFGITLGFYVQKHINIRYGTGVLDGGAIQWDEYNKYGIVNTLVWILCFLLPFLLTLIFRTKKHLSGKIMAIAAIYLTVIQIPGVVVKAVNYQPNNNSELAITDKGLFDLSYKENVIIFILDGMDEAYYRNFIENNPDFTQNLAGFVHYDNTLASGAHTVIGLTSMLTGIPFDRSIDYLDYKEKIWSGDNPLKILNKNGYDVGLYSEKIHFSDSSISYISNFTGGGMKIASPLVFTKLLYKLEMLQIFPHFLKRFVWMDTGDFDETFITSEKDKEKDTSKTYSINDSIFFDNYRTNRFSYNEDKNVVRIYHLHGAHSPYYLSRDGKKVEKSTLEDSVAGLFTGIDLMLNDMKENGVFDKATVIITADHGLEHKAENPVFLLKKSGSIEPYRTDHAPVSLFDLPVFLGSLVNKQVKDQRYGVDLFKLTEDVERERHFYKNNSIEGYVEEYITEGSADDYDSLILIEKHRNKKSKDTAYTFGDTLSFEMEASGNVYITEGSLRNTGFRTALRSKHTRMEIPIKKLPSKGSLNVEINLHKSFTLGNVACHFTANGITVFEGSTTDIKNNKSVISLDVPVDSFDKSKVLTLDFDFPDIDDDEISSDGIISFISMVIVEKK